MDLFCKRRQQVTIILQSALSSVYITCDAWKPSNYLASWEMVGYFTSEESKLVCLLLFLTKIKEPHTRENQANMVWSH